MPNIIELDDNTNELYDHHNTNVGTSISVDSDDSIDSNLDINDAPQEMFSLSNNLVPSIEVRKTFTDWCDVKQYVKAYTISQGFATRLDHTEKSMSIIIRADIVCRRADIPKKTSTGLRTTKSIAIDCSFKIVVHLINSEYSIRSAELKHNHPMDTAVTSFDPGHRKLSHSEKDQVKILFDSGVPVPTIIRMLSEQYGRYIHNKNVYNSLNCYSRDRVKGLSQISELLTHLHNNREYKITYSVNDNKLHCLFFAIQSALTTFKCYPEIVLIDATNKMNRFGMPLLLISGVDAIRITFLIASGLLADETTLTYCWILHQLKKVADDDVINRVRTILTDRDLAVLPAIKTELLHVKHQLCTWHIEQNIVKNLTSKLSSKFVAFSKDFKLVMTETVEDQFTIRWGRLLKEYPEVNSYMKQWKSISHMWAYCYTNKNVNYGIRTTQRSEASNAYLKRLLDHTVPLPELINMLEKLSRNQLERSQYQQYRLRGSTRQQCPELLKNVSMVISDFIYSLLLAQYNSAALYSVEEQGIGLFKVFNKNHEHIVYCTEIELVCYCDYGLQFSLPCHHIIAVHLTRKESLRVNYIGTRWIIPATDTDNIVQPEEPYDINNKENSSTIVLSSLNYDACEIPISKQTTFKSTADLIKEIEVIANRVGYVEINNCLSLFVNKLNNQYPLQQADIGDPTNIKMKGRPSNTKRKKTGAEHSTKKIYVYRVVLAR
ncbi:17554_t:CDS:2 [Racocetra fulgida]|uniref:17554_t:CDS:1 n=1 Tax=Racocetra fulgida TaxID=60492 RepID=A0A9N9GMK1_9GLOM|nr:17554_t:CDS:2 [Racocetra fulgida]